MRHERRGKLTFTQSQSASIGDIKNHLESCGISSKTPGVVDLKRRHDILRERASSLRSDAERRRAVQRVREESSLYDLGFTKRKLQLGIRLGREDRKRLERPRTALRKVSKYK